MSKFYAVRNISLCTKDCLCLYVCPTGASDTENSIIDKTKCIGCGACANACPSKAISLVPGQYPKQQKHNEQVIKAMRLLLESKTNQEKIASTLPNKLAKAIEKSNRIMAEDIIRESGYMLPQSGNTREFLENILLQNSADDLPTEDIKALLAKLNFNEIKEENWKCSICGYTHIGTMRADFNCPLCDYPSTVFKLIK
ncbi:MAG: 4Fe-4S binding protein [Bacillota bacterium]